MGYPACAAGSQPHPTVGLSSIFPGHPGDLETARRCRVGHSAVPTAQGVGLRRCVLRLDGGCCIAIGLGVDECGHDRIPDRNDGCCCRVLGVASAIPPPRSRFESPLKWAGASRVGSYGVGVSRVADSDPASHACHPQIRPLSLIPVTSLLPRKAALSDFARTVGGAIHHPLSS